MTDSEINKKINCAPLLGEVACGVVIDLCNEVKKLRKALKFYANDTTWTTFDRIGKTSYNTEIIQDDWIDVFKNGKLVNIIGGRTARVALDKKL